MKKLIISKNDNIKSLKDKYKLYQAIKRKEKTYGRNKIRSKKITRKII